MRRRDLQSIQLKLSELKEYEQVKLERQKARQQQLGATSSNKTLEAKTEVSGATEVEPVSPSTTPKQQKSLDQSKSSNSTLS